MSEDTAAEREAHDQRASLADAILRAMTDDGHRSPRNQEAIYQAHVAAGAVLAALPGLGWVRAEGLRTEWLVLDRWDEDGEEIAYQGYSEAEAREMEGDALHHRLVTPWVEAPDE